MRIGSRREDDFEINVISLIDVLLTLLMFFVLSTTFVQHSRLKVNLPKADSEAREGTDNALNVVIDRDGHYSVGSDEVMGEGIEPLKTAIQRVAGDDRNRLVVIRADAMTPHQNVVRAMDALGQVGFTRLSIATTPSEAASAQ
ncbi:MAG: biopolymer transporter ExbD [Luteibacter sp.]|uniref:ExbD/TolR family protein n=1 Tax=Rhodanobacteraceae TaxID=1775411 RepID=UPI00056367FB|nr:MULTISPECIES: biopolymer transporter ExbD [Rhodanobacteraceae]MDQ7997981.1 biopolymer transporter ExbD [Luteibacter sp.]MDQ8050542.1 biopolymer transporter ExbD [Luteibacter sp.]MDR6640815.1 biopolymer transport protein ExbD [Luteibacter sp. 1214]SDF37146.1 biopolymer transport protein ExbD [Dyella sp. 333MFSha]SKC04870.1 biopolymer transport protein ExbD [Luteibacter sp. 22Crub2.1]